MTSDLLRELEENIEKLSNPQNIETIELASRKSAEIREFLQEIELLRKDWETIKNQDCALQYLEVLYHTVKSFKEQKSSLHLDEERQRALQERMKELSELILEIEYFGDSDTLTIYTRLDERSMIDMSEEIRIGFDARGRPAGITIENAAELLKPHLLEAMLELGEPPQDEQPGPQQT